MDCDTVDDVPKNHLHLYISDNAAILPRILFLQRSAHMSVDFAFHLDAYDIPSDCKKCKVWWD